MIIVDNASKVLGENVEVLVTSVLQTTAGRMIFSELREIVNEKRARGANSNR
jgi:Integral membrane protein (PIN domain superfamily)